MTRIVNWDKALECAIDSVGGPTKFARAIGVQVPSVYKWHSAPPNRVLDIERATGVPRYVLRPDLWEPPRLRQKAKASVV